MGPGPEKTTSQPSRHKAIGTTYPAPNPRPTQRAKGQGVRTRLTNTLLLLAAVCAGVAVLELAARLLYARIAWGNLSDLPGVIYEPKPGYRYINERGGRGPTYLDPPEPGVCRIIVIGDSVAHGQGIDRDEETFPRQLEQLLNDSVAGNADTGDDHRRYEVYNAAVPGYNIEQVVAAYRHHHATEPHAVVLYALFPNDLDYPTGAWYSEHEGYTLVALPPHTGERPRLRLPGEIAWWLATHSRAYLLLRAATEFARTAADPDISEQRPWTINDPERVTMVRDQLRLFATVARDNNHTPIIAHLPTIDTALNDDERTAFYNSGKLNIADDEDDEIRFLFESAARERLLVADLADAYIGIPYRDLLLDRPDPDWTHPSARGHAAIAHAMLNQWKSLNLDDQCP